MLLLNLPIATLDQLLPEQVLTRHCGSYLRELYSACGTIQYQLVSENRGMTYAELTSTDPGRQRRNRTPQENDQPRHPHQHLQLDMEVDKPEPVPVPVPVPKTPEPVAGIERDDNEGQDVAHSLQEHDPFDMEETLNIAKPHELTNSMNLRPIAYDTSIAASIFRTPAFMTSQAQAPASQRGHAAGM